MRLVPIFQSWTSARLSEPARAMATSKLAIACRSEFLRAVAAINSMRVKEGV